ncbi:hypothetical protein Fot_06213 [Forsythia ovata]|uniref:Uncharacterized protein n=1 Tax=Forsythia ovata TaxID=205694 RepID=A0ABD1WSG5_9LAMI
MALIFFFKASTEAATSDFFPQCLALNRSDLGRLSPLIFLNYKVTSSKKNISRPYNGDRPHLSQTMLVADLCFFVLLLSLGVLVDGDGRIMVNGPISAKLCSF